MDVEAGVVRQGRVAGGPATIHLNAVDGRVEDELNSRLPGEGQQRLNDEERRVLRGSASARDNPLPRTMAERP